MVVNDPNLVYLGLIVSLYAVVTIVYTPGTIIGEVLSAVLTIGTLAIMTQLPTNWGAVMLIIVGVSGFMAMPFIAPRYAAIADAGLILQIVGGLLLFHDGLAVAPLLIMTTVLIAWVYHRVVLLPVLRTHQNAQQPDEATRLIGMIGRVTRMINPTGNVSINGEVWSARSTDVLEIGTEVIVEQKLGLELRVSKAKRDNEPTY